MNLIHSDIACAGRFNVVVKTVNGGVKQDLGWQDNLITDEGLKLLTGVDQQTHKGVVSSNRYITADCVIGSASVEPIFADKKLGMFVAKQVRSEASRYFLEQPTNTRPHYVRTYFRKKYIFSGINNQNITELGLANMVSDTDYVLYTHALLKNESGSPTSITVLDGEILEINYEFSMYWDIRPKRGEITLQHLNGTEVVKKQFDYELRIFDINAETQSGIYPKKSYTYLYSYGVDTTKDTDLNTPYNFDKWANWNTSVDFRTYEAELKKHCLPEETPNSYSGYYHHTGNKWDYSNEYLNVLSESVVGTTRNLKLEFTPYRHNHEHGIRALRFALGSIHDITNYRGSVLVILSEKGSSKGLPKTENDVLLLGLSTTVSRYTGAA